MPRTAATTRRRTTTTRRRTPSSSASTQKATIPKVHKWVNENTRMCCAIQMIEIAFEGLKNRGVPITRLTVAQAGQLVYQFCTCF